LFLQDDKFVELLQQLCYFNLDELGTANPQCVYDGGYHSMTHIHSRYAHRHNFTIPRGANPNDAFYIESHESIRWAGNARWFQGSLQIIHASVDFPAGRELMYYHRPTKEFDLPEHLHDIMFKEMIKYGFFLPNFIPMSSQVMCWKAGTEHLMTAHTAMTYFRPYRRECFLTWNKTY
jgi:hypothetical protein